MLDTSAVIGVLRGHRGLHERTAGAEWIGVSVVSYLEFLAFPDIVLDDQLVFKRFCSRVDVVDLALSQSKLIDRAIFLRQTYRIKLPDAIIAATAIENNAVLITNDQQLLALSARCGELVANSF